MQKVRIIVPMSMQVPKDAPDTEQAYIKRAYPLLVGSVGAEAFLPIAGDEFDPAQATELNCCGLMLIGGYDLHSECYGQSLHEQTHTMHPLKQQSDINWFKWADQQEMPVLGICLGSQIINVVRGGTLIQHLPQVTDQLHRQSDESYTRHSVKITGEKLSQIISEASPQVNSAHHQANATLGENLRVAALAQDASIEAIEDTRDRFVIGVQWHPEDMREEKSTQQLMRAFIQAAIKYRDRQ